MPETQKHMWILMSNIPYFCSILSTRMSKHISVQRPNTEFHSWFNGFKAITLEGLMDKTMCLQTKCWREYFFKKADKFKYGKWGAS
jgi:hypothetical protein